MAKRKPPRLLQCHRLCAVHRPRWLSFRAGGSPSADRSRALLGLLHPGPSAATVAVAALYLVVMTGGHPPLDRLTLMVAMLACQQVAISLHNDWCDRDVDRIAKPWRAIPAGAIAPSHVLVVAACLALGSALCALLLGPVDVLLDATALAAGLAYNAKLKRTPVSWLPFAIAFPLLPMFGAAAVGKSIEPWLGVALAMQPAVLAIHLADSLPDLEADASAGAGGVAVTLGRPLTKWISVVGVAAAGFALGTWTHWHPVEVAASAAGAIVCAVVGGARPAVHRAAIVGGAALVGLGWVSAFAFASSLRPSLLS